MGSWRCKLGLGRGVNRNEEKIEDYLLLLVTVEVATELRSRVKIRDVNAVEAVGRQTGGRKLISGDSPRAGIVPGAGGSWFVNSRRPSREDRSLEGGRQDPEVEICSVVAFVDIDVKDGVCCVASYRLSLAGKASHRARLVDCSRPCFTAFTDAT